MSSPRLRKIFEPAYSPCVHFSGICKGACVWAPQIGLVPRGFGGSTATSDLVRLMLVTSEPGDPADDEQYSGSAADMLSSVLKNRGRYLATSSLRRNGRPEPFNRNLRKILDLCWPDLNIDEQLERTWITNCVKCSAPKSGGEFGEFQEKIEKVCVETYLKREVALFPQAFLIALGKGKVKRRLRQCGIHIDAIASHPSARPKDNPEVTWRSAAHKFQEWLQRCRPTR